MQFDRDSLRTTIKSVHCRNCQTAGNGVAIIEDEGPHFARIECSSCGYWLDWLGWPDPPRKDTRRASRRNLTRLGDDHCWLCLRQRFEIPPPGVIHAHHLLPKADGGSDDPENLWPLCTGCHRLIEWARTYFLHYHPAGEDEAA